MNRFIPNAYSTYINNDIPCYQTLVIFSVKANVISFVVESFDGQGTVTVDEDKANVLFRCAIESNPVAASTLKKDNKPLESDGGSSLTYTISKVSCQDAGQYTCTASNQYNNGNPSVSMLNFFVNCKIYKFTRFNISVNEFIILYKYVILCGQECN